MLIGPGHWLHVPVGKLHDDRHLGIGAMAERSLVVFTVLKLAGAAYLTYLRVHAIGTAEPSGSC